MAEKVIISKQWALSLIDWLKSAGYAVGISVAVELQKYIDAGDLNIDWKRLAMVAAGSFLTLLIGKLVAKPTVKTIYKTNSKAASVGEDLKAN